MTKKKAADEITEGLEPLVVPEPVSEPEPETETPAQESYFLIRDLHPNTVALMVRAGWRRDGAKLVPATV